MHKTCWLSPPPRPRQPCALLCPLIFMTTIPFRAHFHNQFFSYRCSMESVYAESWPCAECWKCWSRFPCLVSCIRFLPFMWLGWMHVTHTCENSMVTNFALSPKLMNVFLRLQTLTTSTRHCLLQASARRDFWICFVKFVYRRPWNFGDTTRCL